MANSTKPAPGNTTTPGGVEGVTGATQLAVGPYASCARLTTGGVSCWGYNSLGTLGNGSTAAAPSPVTVTGITNAKQVSDVFRTRLEALRSECDVIEDVRILGMMIGVELAREGAPVVKACLDRKLLINCTQGTVLRLLPALNLTAEQANAACDVLADVLKEQSHER